MIKYKTGDLLEASEDIIAHGVNCKGVMGSGVAKLIKDRYPKAYFYYWDYHNTDGWKPGMVQFVSQWDQKIIANCATQKAYMPRNVCHADYDAIREAMGILRDYAKFNNKSVAIPKIGAGLAGGDWDTIEKIINDVFDDMDITVYVL